MCQMEKKEKREGGSQAGRDQFHARGGEEEKILLLRPILPCLRNKGVFLFPLAAHPSGSLPLPLPFPPLYSLTPMLPPLSSVHCDFTTQHLHHLWGRLFMTLFGQPTSPPSCGGPPSLYSGHDIINYFPALAPPLAKREGERGRMLSFPFLFPPLLRTPREILPPFLSSFLRRLRNGMGRPKRGRRVE